MKGVGLSRFYTGISKGDIGMYGDFIGIYSDGLGPVGQVAFEAKGGGFQGLGP